MVPMRAFALACALLACKSEPAIVVPVTIDGKAAAPIDAARLRSTAKALDQRERRAWTLAALLGGRYTKPGTLLEIFDDAGEVTRIREPVFLQKGRQLVLAIGSDGKPRVLWWKPGEVIPEATAGTRKPALRELRLSDAPPEPEPPPPPIEVAVLVDGVQRATWTEEWLRQQKAIEVHGDDGTARTGWPLRALVAAGFGKNAVAVAVDGKDRNVPITAQQWNDAARTPLLRLNRRHNLKFQWFGADGRATDDASSVRAVRAIRVVLRK